MAQKNDSNEGKIYIGGITKDMTERMVRGHFAKYGAVTAVDIKRGGFGFVTFWNPSVVNTVLQNEHTINGKLVYVEKVVSREQMASYRASMVDTRCRKDKISKQWVCVSSAGTSMATQGGGGERNISGFSGPALNPPGPSYSAVAWNRQTPSSGGGGGGGASMEETPIGSYGHHGLNYSSTGRYGSNGGGRECIYASGRNGSSNRPAKVNWTNRNSGGLGMQQETGGGLRGYNNITGTSYATWRTESSQGAAGYEAIGQGNVATLQATSSSGGGGSAPIVQPPSLWPPHDQYERQSFATNFDRHGTSGGGSQGIYEWQPSTSTLDGNTSVPRQQTTAAHYPQSFVGTSSGGSAPIGQPPSLCPPHDHDHDHYGRQSFDTNFGGGRQGIDGWQASTSISYNIPGQPSIWDLDPTDYLKMGGIAHKLMEPSSGHPDAPPIMVPRNLWTNDSLQAAAIYEDAEDEWQDLSSSIEAYRQANRKR